MASSFLDVCRFNPTAGGTTDWTYSSAVTGYQSPAAAGAVNGAVYSYRAESADLSQWEVGFGAYNSATGVFARATVLFNSAGTTAKINFSAAPQVAIVALAEDLLPISSVAPITNSIGATVALNNTANFFDGPSVAQGSVGTWFVSGTVTLNDTAQPSTFICKLWDGTTVIASGGTINLSANNVVTVSLSGIITSPAGNLRISCKDLSATTGQILATVGGVANASTLTAYRIK